VEKASRNLPASAYQSAQINGNHYISRGNELRPISSFIDKKGPYSAVAIGFLQSFGIGTTPALLFHNGEMNDNQLSGRQQVIERIRRFVHRRRFDCTMHRTATTME
jgi:hypothetical protein